MHGHHGAVASDRLAVDRYVHSDLAAPLLHRDAPRLINRATFAAIGFALALFALYVRFQTPGHDWNKGDCAMYLMEARNLVEGRPYSQTPFIPQPETYLMSPPTYPIGYPVLLAPLYAAFGLDFSVFKILSSGLLALSTILIFLYVRPFVGDAAAWLISFLTGLSHFYFSVWNTIPSEPIFLVALFLTLLVQDRAERRGAIERSPLSWGLILGAGAWYVCQTRSIGTALIFAMIWREAWLIRGRIRTPRAWLHLAGLAFAFVPLILLSSHYWHSESSYGSQFIWTPKIWFEHLVSCFRIFSYIWINSYSDVLRVALWVVSLPLALIGFCRRLKHGVKVSEAFVISYILILLPYWNVDGRYMGPLSALFLVYAWEGLRTLVRLAPHRVAVSLRYTIAATVVAVAVSNLTPANLKGPDANVSSPAFQDLFAYIRQNTPKNAMFVAREPRWLALFTDRSSLSLPYNSQFSGILDRRNIEYVLLFKRDFHDVASLAPLMAADPNRFVRIYMNTEFEIYKVSHLVAPAVAASIAPN